jgi:hypothetical protein
MYGITPAENELYTVLKQNAHNGKVTNLHQVATSNGIPYAHAKRYNRRLVSKGRIASDRCGLGCQCPVTISLLGEEASQT